MEIFIETVFILFLIYLLVEWVLPWFWYPQLGNHQHPKFLPEELSKITVEINEKARDDREFLKMIMDVLKERYHYGHFYMYFFPHRWFETSLHAIWHDRRPQLCTIYNYLLEGILLNSGRFIAGQIKHKTTMTNFTLHQYLEVTLKDGSKLAIDPWAYGMGQPFGKRVFGFV